MLKTSLRIAGGAAIAALVSAAAVAADGPAGNDKFYASNAIASGDYAQAEHILKAVSYTDDKDPARLINLATVYIQTNRFDKARATLDEVRKLPDEVLILSGGVSYGSHSIAKAMADRLR